MVFGSSWPSVEAFHEARTKGTLITLESKRRKFKCSIADDRGERTALSGVLKQKIGEHFIRGDPVILFVNRRGYAPFVFCPRCGHNPRCRRCDIALSYHKKDNTWACHYCGASLPASRKCPECGGTLVEQRAKGIEAVEEELKNAFPSSRHGLLRLGRRRPEADRRGSSGTSGRERSRSSWAPGCWPAGRMSQGPPGRDYFSRGPARTLRLPGLTEGVLVDHPDDLVCRGR